MKQLICLLVLLLGLNKLNAQGIPSYMPSNGLLAWYALSGNANDSSGNGNNAILQGGVAANDRVGNANAAFQLLADSNRMAGNIAGVNNRRFTLSVWVKFNG